MMVQVGVEPTLMALHVLGWWETCGVETKLKQSNNYGISK